MTPETVIIYGEAGAGKTKNAEALQKHFNCTGIVDDWSPGDKLEYKHLHLTNHAPPFWEEICWDVKVHKYNDLKIKIGALA